MKKVVIWGTGKACRSYKVLFKDLEKKGKLRVVGQYLYEGETSDGWPVLEAKEALCKLQYDAVIIATNQPAIETAKAELRELGVQDEQLETLSGCILDVESEEPTHREIVEHQIQILKRIQEASEEEISDRKWMHSIISDFGVYPFDTKGDLSKNWTHYGLMQMIDEFAEYCVDIAKLEHIEKAIEIGVYRGRSSYFMCAVLSRKNPNLTYKCVDIYDNLDCFEEYQKILPALQKCIPTTSEDYKDEAYDFVFIDADHSYDGSIADYYNVGQNAKVIASFHDIYGHEYDHENGGTVRSWKEVAERNKDKTVKTYSIYPDVWMGIGCVIK